MAQVHNQEVCSKVLIAQEARSRVLIAAVAAIFFATGMSGLVYQVVWQRYLLNIFGATIYSISTVLSAFMGGLALGSWLFGHVAERIRRPLLVYGFLEIGVAVGALAVPTVLKLSDPVFIAAYRHFGSNFVAYSILRFFLVFLILLLPTTMMGGTLPLLSVFVSPRGAGAGLRVGLLYGMNTAGAVIGTILSGFFLIRWWGVWTTVLIAAGINLAAGFAALGLNRLWQGREAHAKGEIMGGTPTPEHEQDAPTMPPGVRPVLWAYAISGFAALGLEVAWSRSLVFTFELLKNTTYSFTAMLAVFLVGIAAGSAAIAPFAGRAKQPYRLFASLQVLIGLASIMSFFVLYYVCYTLGSDWLAQYDKQLAGNIRWNAAVGLVFLRTAAAVFLPTFCMGLAFPVAVRAVTESWPMAGRGIGRLYAMNTVGAILGAALTGFLILPALGIAKTIIALGSFQLMAGVALLLISRDISQTHKLVWGVLGGLPIIVAFVRAPHPAIFQALTPNERMVFYKEGPLATVSVIQNSQNYRTIYVDNVGVAGTEPMLLTDQKSLAHVPMLFLRNPKSALTVGFGSGGASYSYTLYPELEHIDCVEITKTVVEAAPTLTASNRGVVFRRQAGDATPPQSAPLWGNRDNDWRKSDPRFSLILDDVRSYLRFTGRKYDIIATDCTDLRYKSNANLYDLQYFQLTREHITDDGMVVVWMPLAGLSDESMRVALRTFYRVFPEMEVFYMNNEPTHYLLLLGTKTQLQVDVAEVKAKLSRPAISDDLGEIHLASAEKLLSCFICGRSKLEEYLKGETLNTEDFPYLEFESPRFGYSDQPLLANLDALMRYRENPIRLVKSGKRGALLAATLAKHYDAVPDIIAGHRAYRELRIPDAVKAYMAAAKRNPEDVSVANLLALDELQRTAQGQPANSWARWELGRALSLQGRDPEAAAQLNDLLRIPMPQQAAPAQKRDYLHFRKSALGLLADIYTRAGKPERASEYRAELARLAATEPTS